MSGAWSWFVIALVALNIAGCVALLWWTARKRPGTQDSAAPPQTSHVWDGDITEYDKPLPRWWINLFYLTILFTVIYLVVFPGLGRFAGTGRWSSVREHDADRAATEQRLAATFAPYADRPIEELARDPQALRLGYSVFNANCATCHGALARGATGYPDLTDDIWQWGGSGADILQTVLHGRTAQMPPWGEALRAMGGQYATDDVAFFVLSKSDPAVLNLNGYQAAHGEKLFTAICAACHGTDARGNPQLGAPDLTDAYWLYGRSRAAIRAGLEQGRNGAMPAHEPLIGATRARLAAAWVWSLSHPVDTGP
jgi:cytochrome c oxidase cbb3-type subunit III